MTDIDPTKLLDEEDDDFMAAASGGEASDGDDDFDEIELPPTLCGIIHGHITDAKFNPNNRKQVILEIKSEEADSLNATASCFLRLDDARQAARLRTICTTLGVPIQTGNRSFKIVGGIKALKNRGGLFVIDTFERNDGSVSSSLAWGMPKEGRSADWDEYVKQHKFNDEQVKALKASCGVIPKNQHKLFADLGG